jgi:HEAT repeat protein
VDAATLALICAAAGGSWLLLAAGILFARLRSPTRSRPDSCATSGEWQLGEEGSGLAGASEAEARMLLERGLRSREPDVRVAAITALGNLAHRYEWAVDGLMEALAGGIESPVRVAAQLDRLAPRPGRRLTPLLEHPNDAVRFTAVRLLARYAPLARLHVPDLTRDPSPNVRAGALETLRIVHSAEALRCSLELLLDPHPLVRAHASRTSAAIGGPTSAPFLLPLLGDESWWVREAARKALAGFGRDAADLVAPLLESDDGVLRSGAALVLQDIRVVDDLRRDGSDAGELERIVVANGPRLREATAERARWGLRLDGPPEPLTGTAS